MTNGIFKRLGKLAHARAADVMSTRSATAFEWSVKLIGSRNFRVGISSLLKAMEVNISHYDQNAIFYSSWSGTIEIGTNTVYSNLARQENEDVIRFRFQPNAKKLVIDLVRITKILLQSLLMKRQYLTQNLRTELITK